MIAIEHLRRACVHASVEFGRVITVEHLRDRSKARSSVHPRYYVMAYLKAYKPSYSQPQIAHGLNMRNHTTVLHGLRKAIGWDGKGEAQPLWKKEHFEKLAREDRFGVPVTYDEMIVRGEENLSRFTNGSGWRGVRAGVA